MSDGAGKPAAARVRGSKAQIDAVKKTAERAGLELAREQDESVSQVAQALAQITDSEGLAQLDGRLTFAERQIDRLAARRAESDRLIDSELAVMRTRLEETLTAFAAATQEHKETMAASERRLLALASEAERHTRAMLEAIRMELSEKVEDATRSIAHLEARLRGEKLAFEEEAAKRAAALAGSIAAGREVLEQQVGSAVAELDARLDAAVARLEAAQPIDQEAVLSQVKGRMYESDSLEQVERVHAELEAARASARAEVGEVRGELLDAVQASDDKALGAAVHLESMILQVRRRLVGDEAEWSALVGEAGDAVSSLRSRIEDLLGRVSNIEARDATERGSSGAQLDGIDKRLELHEEWSQAAVGEVSEQGLRLNALEAHMAALAAVRELTEEQAGALEYLKGRLHAIEQGRAPEADGAAADGAAAESVSASAPDDASDPPPADTGVLEGRLDALADAQATLGKRLVAIEERLAGLKRRRWI